MMRPSILERLERLEPAAQTAVKRYAREWAEDCAWREAEDDAEFLDTLSDAAVLRHAARHYSGGGAQLVRDALGEAR